MTARTMFGLPPLPRTLAAALADVESSQQRVRTSAIKDLGALAASAGIEAERARTELRKLVVGGTPADVRGESALALADACDARAVPELIRAVSDVNVRVREMALIAISELATVGDKAALAAVKESLPSVHAALRYQAVLAAARVVAVTELEPMVVRAYSDEDAEIRQRVVRVIEERWLAESKSRCPASLQTLLARALEDPSSHVRVAAALACTKLAEPSVELSLRVEQVLCEGLTVRLEPEDEEAVILATAELGLDRAIPSLRRKAWGFLPTPFSWQARVALARLGDVRAQHFILRGLRGWSRDSRTLAAIAAGSAGLIEALPTLQSMSRNAATADPEAVGHAVEQLSGIRGAAKPPAGS